MKRGFKYLSVLITLFSIFFVTSSKAHALPDEACGLILSEKVMVTIKFDVDGGSKVRDLNYCMNCSTTYFKLPTPEKKGYTFDGWYADKNYRVKINQSFVKNDDGNKINLIPDEIGCNVKKAHTTLYAKWIKDEVCPDNTVIDIEFDSDGGSKVDNLSVCEDCDDSRILLNTPIKEDYIFLGWYLEKEFINRLPVSMETPTEIYYMVEDKAIDDDNNCETNKKVTAYARWVDNEEFLGLVIDYADHTFFMINDIANR